MFLFRSETAQSTYHGVEADKAALLTQEGPGSRLFWEIIIAKEDGIGAINDCYPGTWAHPMPYHAAALVLEPFACALSLTEDNKNKPDKGGSYLQLLNEFRIRFTENSRVLQVWLNHKNNGKSKGFRFSNIDLTNLGNNIFHHSMREIVQNIPECVRHLGQ